MFAKRFFYVCAGLLCLAFAYHLGAKDAGGKPPNTLLAMTDNPRSASSAIAIDQAGGIYLGSLRHWTRVATTASAPADLWTRSSTGEVFVVLLNGDLFRLEADWTLTYDSNVFSSQ
jgi:hypothetical protein